MTKKRKIEVPIEDAGDAVDEAARQAEEALNQAEDAGREVSDELAEVAQEAGVTLDHLQRLQAEFDNYRKRTNRERVETGARAQAQLVEQLLPALDDLDRAAETVEDPESGVAKGFLLVREKMFGTLTSLGLERIEAVGETFDPNQHEALLTEPVEDDRAGTVLEELVAGYTFSGRVIRPARVKVGVEAGE